MNKKQTKNPPYTFTRWCRSNWAAFASFGREVRIGVLAVGMGFGNVSLVVAMETVAEHSEEASADSVQLRELEVTVRRAYPARGTVLSTTLVDADRLQHSAMPTIESALKIHPAVDVRERGGMASQADVGVYGSNEDQTMIMLNGIDFSDPRTGHQSNSLPIDVENLQRVTVTTDIIGAGAYSGGVNYVTRKSERTNFSGGVTAGDFGLWRARVGGGTAWKHGSVMASSSYTKSDGYLENTDFNNINIYAYATINPTTASGKSLGDFDLQGGWQRREFGSRGFYSLKYPWQWERTETALGSVRWRYVASQKVTLSAFAAYRRNADRYELYRHGYEAPSWYKGPNHHLTDNAQAGVQVDYRFLPDYTLSAGVDYNYNHIYSNVLGKDMAKPKKVHGYPGAYYLKQYDRTILNYWIRQGAHFTSWFHANLSVNVVQNPYSTAWMWGGAVCFKPKAGCTIDISASRTMRLPTFTDLFYTAADHVSNPNLRPEIANTVRLGAQWTHKIFSAGLNAYYRHGTNVIDWLRPTAESLWHSTQIGTVGTLGVTANAGMQWKSGFIRNIQLLYGYTHSTSHNRGQMSKNNPAILRNKVGANLQTHVTKGFDITLSATYFDRNGIYFDAEGAKVNFKDYFLLDARAMWKYKIVTLHADVNNILNQKYCDYGGLEMPGRWFSAGISVDF